MRPKIPAPDSLLPVLHHRNTEAFRQGQRDREQGWPSLDWGFQGELLTCYRQGYDHPRPDLLP